MSEVEKMTAVSIVAKHGQNAWDVECIHELRCTLKVKMSDITVLQPAILMVIDNPSHCGILDSTTRRILSKTITATMILLRMLRIKESRLIQALQCTNASL